MSHKQPKPLSRFHLWAWSPIIVLRVALVVTYLLYIYSGVVAIVFGIPVFALTAVDGYAPLWGVLMCVAAVVSAVGALTDRWQVWERWASLALSSLMLTYAAALNVIAWFEHDSTRMFVGAVAVIALVLPICRFSFLAAQAGKKKAPTT